MFRDHKARGTELGKKIQAREVQIGIHIAVPALAPQALVEKLRIVRDQRRRRRFRLRPDLARHFGERLYRTVIPRNVRLAEAPSHGIPLMRYARSRAPVPLIQWRW